MRTVGEVVSTLKNLIKAVKQDSFLTDRFVYNLFLKNAKMIMRRQDSQNKVMKFNPVFQSINYLELEEIDKVEARCSGIKCDCTIMRTKCKLPNFVEGYWGALIRSVTSIDGSDEFQPTYPTTYLNIANQKNFKYNNTKYYWFLDGHLYFPNIDWEAVRIEALFEDDVTDWSCGCTQCTQKQDQLLYIPEYLHSDIEKMVMQDLGFMLKVPSDQQEDNVSITK